MAVHLDIGPEPNLNPELPSRSVHVLNLKNVDAGKKNEAHAQVSVDLKEEIHVQKNKPGRICILGELPPHRRGLGRLPMVAAALLVLLALNLGQILFLGKQEGSEALALAGEAFLSLQGASQSVLTGEQGADLILFEEAQALFDAAEEKGSFLLHNESSWLSRPGQVDSLQNLLDAGHAMASMGIHIANARKEIQNLPQESSLTDFIHEISEQHIEPAAAELERVRTLLRTVDLSDTAYAEQLLAFQEKLDELSGFFRLWMEAKEPLLTALGDRYPQHYLVLLENNDEMRLGGGFIGSLALLEINEGHVSDLSFHDVYSFDNRYFTHQEVPVHELKNLTAEWRLRDSSISPDFSISAQKALWFLEQEGGPGVDGVIAVNLSAAQALLETTGPVHLPSLPQELNAETFPAVISTFVEAKVNKENPKALLAELMNAVLEKTTEEQIQMALGQTALEEAHKKQILLYHKDPSVQAFFDSMGLTGTLPELSTLDHDFFMPLFTNRGGNKTDRYLSTHIQHNTQIFEDGSMVASITLIRSHTFDNAASQWLKKTLNHYGFTAWNEDLEQVLGKAQNFSGIRLYVPPQSTLLETEGLLRDEVQFYYDPFLDLSYYYVDQVLSPSETQSFTLHFALPWNFKGRFEEYRFNLFKQPGLKSVTYEKIVTANGDTLLSGYPLATSFQEGTDYVLSGTLNNDVHVQLLYH